MTDQRMTHGYRGESARSRWHRSARGRTGEVTSEGCRRSRETYELRHPGTTSPVEFGTHPGQESYLTFLNGMPVLGYLPFGRSLWEAQWGELVIVTPNDNYEIRAYDRATGALARQGYQNMPLVEQFPAFRMLLTDPLNHLWVREATLPGMDRPAPLWTVFDPRGESARVHRDAGWSVGLRDRCRLPAGSCHRRSGCRAGAGLGVGVGGGVGNVTCTYPSAVAGYPHWPRLRGVEQAAETSPGLCRCDFPHGSISGSTFRCSRYISLTKPTACR